MKNFNIRNKPIKVKQLPMIKDAVTPRNSKLKGATTPKRSVSIKQQQQQV